MGFKLDRVHVWSGEVADTAGGVAAKLSMLAQSGANLEFVLAGHLAYYRLALPALPGNEAGTHEGTWTAILRDLPAVVSVEVQTLS